jgi:arsenate reductase
MREVDIDLSSARPQALSEELQRAADHAVTMGCGDACPLVRAPVSEWDIPDPAGQPLPRVRAIRDEIQRQVEDLVRELVPDQEPEAEAT